MTQTNTVIAIFADHDLAEAAVKKLAQAGFDMKSLSVVGKGYHTEEKVIGFYNVEDRMKFWGQRGAFWGGLWGLIGGGIFLTIPAIGPVMMLGYLAHLAASVVVGAVEVGGLGVLSAILFNGGIPKDSVIKYETALKTDEFLVMAHGAAEQVAHAKEILQTANPTSLDLHEVAKAA